MPITRRGRRRGDSPSLLQQWRARHEPRPAGRHANRAPADPPAAAPVMAEARPLTLDTLWATR
jgi:hypothetical protein